MENRYYEIFIPRCLIVSRLKGLDFIEAWILLKIFKNGCVIDVMEIFKKNIINVRVYIRRG